MGDTTYITPANDYLAKLMAIAINDADGSVVWAKKYSEGQVDYIDSYKHYITGYAVNPNKIIYVGKYYDAVVDPHGAGHRRVSLLRISEADGLSNGIMIYDVPNDDFAGMSMNEDGSGGYLAIGTPDIVPLDTFQLIYSRVNNVKFSSDSFLDNVLLVIIHKESLSL